MQPEPSDLIASGYEAFYARVGSESDIASNMAAAVRHRAQIPEEFAHISSFPHAPKCGR